MWFYDLKKEKEKFNFTCQIEMEFKNKEIEGI